jgi:DNA-binding NtrC family response regulator
MRSNDRRRVSFLPEEMPLEMLPRVLERDPNLAVMAIPAQTDAQTASLCLRQAAFDFLTKLVERLVLSPECALSQRVGIMTDRETRKLRPAEEFDDVQRCPCDREPVAGAESRSGPDRALRAWPP